MATVLGANTLSSGGYQVDNSVRFDDGSGDILARSNGTPSSQRLFTFSGWYKKATLADGVNFQFFALYNDNTDRMDFRFQDGDTIDFRNNSPRCRLTTNRLFRDPAAWYHVVLRVDTTQSTAANRIRLYINGVQETSFSAEDYGDQNDDLITDASTFAVGDDSYGTAHFDGYMCEVAYCDGQSLAPTSFGEFDEDSGTWKPISVSGLTFGDQGFYLEFKGTGTSANSSGIGADTSGNDNHLTVTALTATSQSTDTCTNNFATFNPLVKPAAAIPLSEGNLKGVFPGSWTALPATFGLTKGKWYFEAKNITSGQNAFIGVVTENQKWDDGTPYNETTGVVLYGPGGRKTVDNTSNDGFFATLSSGQIVGVALDLDSGTKTIQFSVNGTDTPNSTPVDLPSTFDDVFIFPYFIGNSSSETSNWELNFGSPPYAISSGNADGDGYGNFEYAVPSGFFAINTKNLAEYGG